jgi:hypothetical protein
MGARRSGIGDMMQTALPLDGTAGAPRKRGREPGFVSPMKGKKIDGRIHRSPRRDPREFILAEMCADPAWCGRVLLGEVKPEWSESFRVRVVLDKLYVPDRMRAQLMLYHGEHRNRPACEVLSHRETGRRRTVGRRAAISTDQDLEAFGMVKIERVWTSRARARGRLNGYNRVKLEGRFWDALRRAARGPETARHEDIKADTPPRDGDVIRLPPPSPDSPRPAPTKLATRPPRHPAQPPATPPPRPERPAAERFPDDAAAPFAVRAIVKLLRTRAERQRVPDLGGWFPAHVWHEIAKGGQLYSIPRVLTGLEQALDKIDVLEGTEARNHVIGCIKSLFSGEAPSPEAKEIATWAERSEHASKHPAGPSAALAPAPPKARATSAAVVEVAIGGVRPPPGFANITARPVVPNPPRRVPLEQQLGALRGDDPAWSLPLLGANADAADETRENAAPPAATGTGPPE